MERYTFWLHHLFVWQYWLETCELRLESSHKTLRKHVVASFWRNIRFLLNWHFKFFETLSDLFGTWVKHFWLIFTAIYILVSTGHFCGIWNLTPIGDFLRFFFPQRFESRIILRHEVGLLNRNVHWNVRADIVWWVEH
jgi:hypothetical protein